MHASSNTNINPGNGRVIYETCKWEISNKLILKIVHITFFNGVINIQDFDWSLPKINRKSCKNIVIYHIGCIIIKEIVDYENIYCVNFLHYIINKADGYIEEDNGNEYLFFAFSGKNKEVLTKYTELWDKIECLNQTINCGKVGE